jgi:hypothetical protein
MPLSFEWDSGKAGANLAKHGVSFEEASTLFGDERALTIPDPAHSLVEQRFITIGISHKQRILVAVHTDRDNNLRLISTRCASRKGRRQYEEAIR